VLRGWAFRVTKLAQSSLELQLPLTKTLFPRCPGAKTPARTDLGETPDPEGHIPHGTPDDGVMPPGPSSEASSQNGSNNNHGNEGPDYPGDLDDKSPESSPSVHETSISQRLTSSTIPRNTAWATTPI